MYLDLTERKTAEKCSAIARSRCVSCICVIGMIGREYRGIVAVDTSRVDRTKDDEALADVSRLIEHNTKRGRQQA